MRKGKRSNDKPMFYIWAVCLIFFAILFLMLPDTGWGDSPIVKKTWVYARDEGLLGDGTTDETTAMRAFLAKAKGKIAILDSNVTYRLLDSVALDNVILDGRGATLSFELDNEKGLCIGDNSTVQNLTVYVDSSANNVGSELYGAAISIGSRDGSAGYSDIVIENVTAKTIDNGGADIVIAGDCYNISLNNIRCETFDDSTRFGLLFKFAEDTNDSTYHPYNIYARNIVIDSLDPIDTNGYAVSIDGAFGVTVENVIADYCYLGLDIRPDSNGFTHAHSSTPVDTLRHTFAPSVIVRNSNFLKCWTYGARISGSVFDPDDGTTDTATLPTLIQNCTFRAYDTVAGSGYDGADPAAVVLRFYANDIVFDHCTFSYWYWATALGVTDHVVWRNCVFSYNQRNVDINSSYYPDAIVIDGCRIHHSSGESGIHLGKAKHVTVKDCIMGQKGEPNMQYGIHVSGDDNDSAVFKIYGNHVIDIKDVGASQAYRIDQPTDIFWFEGNSIDTNYIAVTDYCDNDIYYRGYIPRGHIGGFPLPDSADNPATGDVLRFNADSTWDYSAPPGAGSGDDISFAAVHPDSSEHDIVDPTIMVDSVKGDSIFGYVPNPVDSAIGADTADYAKNALKADSALKATQDKDDNDITTTYVPLAGTNAMSGHIRLDANNAYSLGNTTNYWDSIYYIDLYGTSITVALIDNDGTPITFNDGILGDGGDGDIISGFDEVETDTVTVNSEPIKDFSGTRLSVSGGDLNVDLTGALIANADVDGSADIASSKLASNVMVEGDDIIDLNGTAYRQYQTDGSGNMQAFDLGTANQVWTSNGLTVASSWQAAPTGIWGQDGDTTALVIAGDTVMKFIINPANDTVYTLPGAGITWVMGPDTITVMDSAKVIGYITVDSINVINFAINGQYYPTTDGTANQVITTNGSGVLSWNDQTGGSGTADSAILDMGAGVYKSSTDKAWKLRFTDGIELDGTLTDSSSIDTVAIKATLGTSVDVTSEITGIVPIANGGTGGTSEDDPALEVNAITLGLNSGAAATVTVTMSPDAGDDGLFSWNGSTNKFGLDRSTDVTGDFEATGTVTGTYIYGDGSPLTNVGTAAGTAQSFNARNDEGATITIGQAVYISGATGQTSNVKLADVTVISETHTIGLAAQTVTAGQPLLVITWGALNGVNTTGGALPSGDLGADWNDGDDLFVDTNGCLTTVEPTRGWVIHIGHVEYDNASGEIQVGRMPMPIMAVAAGEDLVFRMGDDAGSQKVSFKDYGNAEVASVNSNGILTADGVFKVSAAEPDSELVTANTINDSGDVLRAEMQDSAATAYATKLCDTVRNMTGVTLGALTPVYITGENAGFNTVDSAKSSDTSTMQSMGILSEAIDHTNNGLVVHFGNILGVDTDTPGWNIKDHLYVAPNGGLTSTKPTGTNLIQSVAIVTRVHVTQGSIEVMGAYRTNDVPNIPSTNFWVGNGSAVATPVAMSGQATMDNTGAVDVSGLTTADFETNLKDTITETYDSVASWSDTIPAVATGIDTTDAALTTRINNLAAANYDDSITDKALFTRGLTVYGPIAETNRRYDVEINSAIGFQQDTCISCDSTTADSAWFIGPINCDFCAADSVAKYRNAGIALNPGIVYFPNGWPAQVESVYVWWEPGPVGGYIADIADTSTYCTGNCDSVRTVYSYPHKYWITICALGYPGNTGGATYDENPQVFCSDDGKYFTNQLGPDSRDTLKNWLADSSDFNIETYYGFDTPSNIFWAWKDLGTGDDSSVAFFLDTLNVPAIQRALWDSVTIQSHSSHPNDILTDHLSDQDMVAGQDGNLYITFRACWNADERVGFNSHTRCGMQSMRTSNGYIWDGPFQITPLMVALTPSLIQKNDSFYLFMIPNYDAGVVGRGDTILRIPGKPVGRKIMKYVNDNCTTIFQPAYGDHPMCSVEYKAADCDSSNLWHLEVEHNGAGGLIGIAGTNHKGICGEYGANNPAGITLLKSMDDGDIWEMAEFPVMWDGRTGQWDKDISNRHSAYWNGDKLGLYYTGLNDGRWSIGYTDVYFTKAEYDLYSIPGDPTETDVNLFFNYFRDDTFLVTQDSATEASADDKPRFQRTFDRAFKSARIEFEFQTSADDGTDSVYIDSMFIYGPKTGQKIADSIYWTNDSTWVGKAFSNYTVRFQYDFLAGQQIMLRLATQFPVDAEYLNVRRATIVGAEK